MKHLRSIDKKNALLAVIFIFGIYAIIYLLSFLLSGVFNSKGSSADSGNGVEKTISDLKKITDSTNVAAKDLNIEILRSNFDFADATLKKMESDSSSGRSISFGDISAIAESRGVYRARLQLSCQQFIEEKAVVSKVSPNNKNLKYCLENWDFPTAYKLP